MFAPWSFSKATSFFTCQRQFYLRYIKKYPENKTKETRLGLAVHNIFANVLRNACDFKQALTQVAVQQRLTAEDIQNIVLVEKTIATFVDKYKQQPKKIEYRFGLDRNNTPCDFFSPNVYFRGVCDVIILGEKPQVIDIKTSRNSPEIRTSYIQQLWLYTWAIQKVFKLSDIQAQLFFVYDNIERNVGMQNAESYIQQFFADIQKSNRVSDIPTPGLHCSYCGYQESCNGKYVEQNMEPTKY